MAEQHAKKDDDVQLMHALLSESCKLDKYASLAAMTKSDSNEQPSPNYEAYNS